MDMTWTGSAAVCVNDRNEILLVLQGKPEEEKRWSVPSGGRLPGESFEDCCRREVWEETGYEVEPREELFVKSGIVHYFRAELVGGSRAIHDPDGLIYDVAWKALAEVRDLVLCFEEDRKFLLRWLERRGQDDGQD
jgi:ADP-ribose pyrophosphatase YjhB (NUDIX family)